MSVSDSDSDDRSPPRCRLSRQGLLTQETVRQSCSPEPDTRSQQPVVTPQPSQSQPSFMRPLTKSKRINSGGPTALMRRSLQAADSHLPVSRLANPSWTEGPAAGGTSAVDLPAADIKVNDEGAESGCRSCAEKEKELSASQDKVEVLKRANFRLQAALQSTKCVAPEVLTQRDDTISRLEAQLAEESARYGRLKKAKDLLKARVDQLSSQESQRQAKAKAAAEAAAETVKALAAAQRSADAAHAALQAAQRGWSASEARCSALFTGGLAACESMHQTLIAVGGVVRDCECARVPQGARALSRPISLHALSPYLPPSLTPPFLSFLHSLQALHDAIRTI
jgi:hypothetical protein